MPLGNWFQKRRSGPPPDSRWLPDGVSAHDLGGPQFVGEQTGVVADALHTEFRTALAGLTQVQRAYFCTLRYPGAERIGAAVCVVCSAGQDILVVEALSAVIRSNLSAGAHIDILFLSPLLERSIANVCLPFFDRAEPGGMGETPMSEGASKEIPNFTCAQFIGLSEAEQRAFVVGVANGRGMTSGLFEAYAGAAQEMAESASERDAIAASYQTVRGMMEPLLTIDAASLLNGVRAACLRAELRDRLVIEALASVHLEVSRSLRDFREKSGG